MILHNLYIIIKPIEMWHALDYHVDHKWRRTLTDKWKRTLIIQDYYVYVIYSLCKVLNIYQWFFIETRYQWSILM